MSQLKSECEVVRDLLPLYQDEVCSLASKEIVDEHLKTCSECRKIAEQLKNTEIDDHFINERNKVLYTHEKKEKKRSFQIGVAMAGLLMVPIIVCLICNLVIGARLDWFFIVLASIMVVASLSVVPLVVDEKKGVYTIGTFTGSLLILLGVCNIYTHGGWFMIAAVSSVFGISLFFMPYIIYQISLPEELADKKGLSVMVWDSIWLYMVIIVCGIQLRVASDYWRLAISITTYCLILIWSIFAVVRYVKANNWIRGGIICIIVGIYATLSNDIMSVVLGQPAMQSIKYAGGDASNFQVQTANVFLTLLILFILVGLGLIAVGFVKSREKKDKVI